MIGRAQSLIGAGPGRTQRRRCRNLRTEGRLVYTRTGMPEYKRYLDEMPGVPLQEIWTDIDPINSQAAER